ncbi:hypothetical protein N9937_01190 [bacterium]|nr:hypothetical protein [bacterium]
MTEYDNRGQVSLWKPDTTNPKAPAASGTVIAHRDIKEGEVLSIALWKNDSAHPNAPLMKGKISDKREAQDAQPHVEGFRETPPADDFVSDDIPF